MRRRTAVAVEGAARAWCAPARVVRNMHMLKHLRRRMRMRMHVHMRRCAPAWVERNKAIRTSLSRARADLVHRWGSSLLRAAVADPAALAALGPAETRELSA